MFPNSLYGHYHNTPMGLLLYQSQGQIRQCGEDMRSVKWGGGTVSSLITMDHSAPAPDKQLQSWEYVGRIYHAKASDRAKT